MRCTRISRLPAAMSQNARCPGNDFAPLLPLRRGASGQHTTLGDIPSVAAPAKQAPAPASLTGCICTTIPFFQRVSRQPKVQNANGVVDADNPANKTKEEQSRADYPPSGAADATASEACPSAEPGRCGRDRAHPVGDRSCDSRGAQIP